MFSPSFVILIFFGGFVGVFSQEPFWDNAEICQDQVGRVAKLNSNCDEYFLCTSQNGVITGALYTCPTGSKFSPVDKRCVRGFECPESTSVIVDKNITSSTASPIPENVIKCNSTGNFINPKSSNCSTYIQCNLTNGQLVGKIVECTIGKSFSYSTLECVVEPKRCPPSDVRTNRVCKGPGRFLNDEDKSCSSYVLCILSNNSNGDKFMVSQIYKCPGNTLFYVPESRCILKTNVPNYACPIANTPAPNATTTTIRPTISPNATTIASNGTTTRSPSSSKLPPTAVPSTSAPTTLITIRTTVGNVTTTRPTNSTAKPTNARKFFFIRRLNQDNK